MTTNIRDNLCLALALYTCQSLTCLTALITPGHGPGNLPLLQLRSQQVAIRNYYWHFRGEAVRGVLGGPQLYALALVLALALALVLALRIGKKLRRWYASLVC